MQTTNPTEKIGTAAKSNGERYNVIIEHGPQVRTIHIPYASKDYARRGDCIRWAKRVLADPTNQAEWYV